MFRPDQPFQTDPKGKPLKRKDGSYYLNPLYKSYVRGVVGMDYEERREWRNLGCRLSISDEARLVDLVGTYVFLETPIGGNGNGE